MDDEDSLARVGQPSRFIQVSDHTLVHWHYWVPQPGTDPLCRHSIEASRLSVLNLHYCRTVFCYLLQVFQSFQVQIKASSVPPTPVITISKSQQYSQVYFQLNPTSTKHFFTMILQSIPINLLVLFTISTLAIADKIACFPDEAAYCCVDNDINEYVLIIHLSNWIKSSPNQRFDGASTDFSRLRLGGKLIQVFPRSCILAPQDENGRGVCDETTTTESGGIASTAMCLIVRLFHILAPKVTFVMVLRPLCHVDQTLKSILSEKRH
jgi:hypothetical protein